MIKMKMGHKKSGYCGQVVIVGRWSLFRGGRWLRFHCSHSFDNNRKTMQCYHFHTFNPIHPNSVITNYTGWSIFVCFCQERLMK